MDEERRARAAGRLRSLQAQNRAIGLEMGEMAPRFKRLADPASAPRAVSSFNLFQTPTDLADTMAQRLDFSPGDRILEPSAGLGRLWLALLRVGHDGPVTLVEQSPDLCGELYGMIDCGSSARLLQRDFLEVETAAAGGPFDRVIMNPPFKRGRDVKHIRHALGMLRPGGRIVALCFNGKQQRRAFHPEGDRRHLLAGASCYWEELPAGIFKETGTRADVVMLTIDKP